MNNDVTLLSSMKEDEVDLFSLNYYSVQKFNPGSEHKTVLVNNTGEIISELDGVNIVSGIDDDLIEALLCKPESDEVGLALMLGLRAVDTRYICVLDPDFFVVCPFWIEAMKAHMEATDVGIITAPPYPLHYNKRNTVTNNFIFIDTERFPKALINFLPSKREAGAFVIRNEEKIRKIVGDKLYRYFDKNTSYDCGDQIEMRSETKIEYLTALYNHKQSPYYTWLERILPERFRLINKNVFYVSLANLESEFEVWVWNAIPFGIHCRKCFTAARTDDYTVPMNVLSKIVSHLLCGYGMAVDGMK